MRRILALVALAVSAWYLSNRQRRAQIQSTVQDMMSSLLGARSQEATATLDKMAAAARAKVEDVRPQAAATASNVAGMARSAADLAAQKARQVTRAAAQGAGDAARVQEAFGAVTDRAQQAAQPATGGEPEPAEPAAGAAAEPAAAPTAPGSVHTDVDTPPLPVREAVQAELADIDDRVHDVSAQAAPEPTEHGAVRSADAATSGARGGEAMDADGVTDVGGTREGEAADEGIAPQGQRPRPVAGAGTTTPAGGALRPLSPIGGEPTSTGVPEELPPELTPGEPGTGGPAGSSRAPSRPDSAETPTTGMERPPVVDRAAEVAQRTSGQFVGNKTTRVFHPATSDSLPAERNRVYFETEEEAIAAGFRPAEDEGLESPGS